jgi:hypothetical protein
MPEFRTGGCDEPREANAGLAIRSRGHARAKLVAAGGGLFQTPASRCLIEYLGSRNRGTTSPL